MRGRLPADRTRPHAAGPSFPDWGTVEWYVYCDTFKLDRGLVEYHCYRIAPRLLSQKECRRFETLVAVVKRCSLRTVRDLLKRGVAAGELQAKVDEKAAAQAARRATGPNAYLAFLAEVERKGREEYEARKKAAQAKEAA